MKNLEIHFSESRFLCSVKRKQFKKIYKQIYPHGKPNKFSNRIFDVFDRDKDNKIDFAEFLCGLNITIHGDFDKKLKCAFEMYDLDGDGKIGKKEMKVIVDSIFELIGEDKKKLTNNKVKMIFEKMDTDKVGLTSIFHNVNSHTYMELTYKMEVSGSLTRKTRVRALMYIENRKKASQ